MTPMFTSVIIALESTSVTKVFIIMQWISFQMEADVILVYPSQEKINVTLIEVKKSRNGNLNTGLVSGAFRQLVRDVKLILFLIPDLHQDQFDI